MKIESHFDLEDFKVIEKIEHAYFPNENITPAEEVFHWYQRNPYTCIGVRNYENKIIASVNILPLKKEIFYAIYENQMNEAEVLAEQIETYDDYKSYFIYLSSISIDKKYRNHYQIITTLLKGCISIFEQLLKKNIQIDQVMVDASTIYGEKICRKLLKMKFIRETSHASKICWENGEEFIQNLNQWKKYLKNN